MIVRVNTDRRLRGLERRLFQGDYEAAEQILWHFARIGGWILPPGWKAEGGGPPFASTLNDRRAYMIRLLGYLGWPGAEELRQVVGGQAPEPEELLHWPGHYATRPIHDLPRTKPFSQIGPKIAEELGPEVMQALAAACVKEVFPITGLPPEILAEALDAIRRLTEIENRWRGSPGISYEEFLEEAEPVRRYLDDLHIPRHVFDLYQSGMSASMDYAKMHALWAFSWFIRAPGRHRSDQPKEYAEVIFEAIYAEAFACDAERGNDPGESAAGRRSRWSYGRPSRARTGWGDEYGARPSRGCVTKANRKLKRAMIAPAVLAIASELVRNR